MSATSCSGLCLTASEIGIDVPGNPVAYPHPLCPEHGEPHHFTPCDDEPILCQLCGVGLGEHMAIEEWGS